LIEKGGDKTSGDPVASLPRMTTRRWMVAVAFAALLSAGLVAMIGLYGERWHYLKWAIDHFAAVRERTGDIQEMSEATRAPALPPPSGR
jgi:hypothetical protein